LSSHTALFIGALNFYAEAGAVGLAPVRCELVVAGLARLSVRWWEVVGVVSIVGFPFSRFLSWPPGSGSDVCGRCENLRSLSGLEEKRHPFPGIFFRWSVVGGR
jgi:hypothetical protein